MKKVEFFLACRAVKSSSARIIIHVLAFVEKKESWARAKAGIKREFFR